MPSTRGRAFGLLDTVVVLFISSALVLFVLWLGATFAGIAVLDRLPDWLSKGMSGIWTWLTTGAAAAAALRYRLRQRAGSREKLPNFPLAIAGATIAMVSLVLGVMKSVTPPPDPPAPDSPFVLKLRVSAAEPQKHPPLSFIQRQPKWQEALGLAALPGGNLYQVRIDLPQPAGEFRAAVQPINEEGGIYTDNLHPTPLEVCFIRARPDPSSGVSHYYARIDCRLGQGCSVHPQEDPGWARDCPRDHNWRFLPQCCTPVAYAQAPPTKSQTETGWLVPSLPTLRKLREAKKIGYTEFLIQSGPLQDLAGSDYFTYDIKVNGTPVSVDGWRGNDLRMPLEPSKGIALQFGLENLNFSGADSGCETIDVQITVFQEDKRIKTYRLFRTYAALRDAAPVAIAAEDGLSFQWSGRYLNPDVGDRYEVFVNSTADAKYAGQVKARIDQAGLKYEGRDLVGVVRPPLNNPTYGVIVGFRLPSSQVRFIFDNKVAQALTAWIQNSRGVAAVRATFPKPVFIYKLRGDDGVPKFKPCAAAGSRS